MKHQILNIIDVKPVFYVYNSVHEELVEDHNVYGLHKLLYLALKAHKYKDDIVFCFDSKTDRNEILGSYKTGRAVRADVEFLVKVILSIIDKMNIPYYKQENREADDLVNSLVNKYEKSYDKIVISTNDTDLSCNVRSNVSIYQLLAKKPNVNKQNYPYALIAGKYIPYNSIAVYKVIFGDGSDAIPALHIDKIYDTTRDKLFGHFISFMKNNDIAQESWSERDNLELWLAEFCSVFNDDLFENIYKRIEVICPRKCNIGEIHNNLNLKEIGKFCSMFGFTNLINDFNLPYEPNCKILLNNLLEDIKNDNNKGRLSTSFGTGW